MAHAPGGAAPPAAVLPAPAIVPAGPIRSYARFYLEADDALRGRYAPLYTSHLTDSGENHDDLLARLVGAADVVPKAFLCLVREGTTLRVLLLHRIARYAAHPTTSSAWDNRVFAFASDVMPGNYIEMAELPDNAFDVTVRQQRVPTIAHADALLLAAAAAAAASGPNNRTAILQPPADGDDGPDSEEIATRYLVQVPPAYVHLVVGRKLTPREVWEELVGAIRLDGREEDCRHLVNWARVALTLRTADDGHAGPPQPPVNCLGNVTEALPPLAVDAALQQHRWDLLSRDLPALDPAARRRRGAPPEAGRYQKKSKKMTFQVEDMVPTPLDALLPAKDVEPEFVCPDRYLTDMKGEIMNRLEEQDGGAGDKRVPPTAVVRCSRGGKTRTLYEIAHMMRNESPQTREDHLAVLFITFNDFMSLLETEKQDEDMLQVFLKRVAFMATYKFEKSFSQDPIDDIAIAFDEFRSSSTFYDPELFVAWFGNFDILLIVDELNNLSGLDDGDRKGEAKVLGDFLKKNFLSRIGRYFVFSSHLISTVSDFGEFVQVSHGSYQGVVLRELPLVPNLETATKKLYPGLAGAREATYFGLMPGSIYARATKRKLAGNRAALVDTFLNEKADDLEGAFMEICRSLVTGYAADLPKSLQFLCDGCSEELGESRIRWVPFHLQYVMERFGHQNNRRLRILADAIGTLCKQLLEAKEKSGDGWEGIFVLFLLARCIANTPDDLFLPKDWFWESALSINYNNYFSKTRNLDQCTKWVELKEGIEATETPSLSILYPTHAQFEAYDAFAVFAVKKSMVVYGYQLKEGKSKSSQPVESSLRKSFVVRGASTKVCTMDKDWCIPGQEELANFFGPCGTHWTPQAWAEFLQFGTTE